MPFVLNLCYDTCVPSVQSYSIANEEPIANPITRLREEFSSQDERNLFENFEQVREVESIDQVLTDNQNGFSSESLYFLSSTIAEEDSILGQGEYHHSYKSCSN